MVLVLVFSLVATPVAAAPSQDSVIYTVGDDGVTAFDASGNILWTNPVALSSPVRMDVSPDGSTVYAAGKFSDTLVAINAGDGSTRWSQSLSITAHDVVATPNGDVLIVGDNIVEYDATDGTATTLNDATNILTPRTAAYSESGELFVAAEDGIYQLDPATGSITNSMTGVESNLGSGMDVIGSNVVLVEWDEAAFAQNIITVDTGLTTTTTVKSGLEGGNEFDAGSQYIYTTELSKYDTTGSLLASDTAAGQVSVTDDAVWSSDASNIRAHSKDTLAQDTTFAHSRTGIYDLVAYLPEQNTAPVADAGADQSVVVGDTVSFDGSASSDADSDVLTYSWDFDGDGVEDATGATPTYSYAAAGSYTVTLTVSDGTATATDSMTVTVGEANNPPVIDSGLDPATNITATVNESVSFDASNSTDADGDSLTYSWDFDGDGTTDSTNATATYTYDTAGTYNASLTVSDGTDSVSETYTVVVEESTDDGTTTTTEEPTTEESVGGGSGSDGLSTESILAIIGSFLFLVAVGVAVKRIA